MPAVMRLKTADDARRALAQVIRDLKANTIDVGRARCMVYALATLATIVRDSDLEARLAALEAAHEND